MIHWLQSLSENGFDVFIVVFLAVLHLVYHYLMRWYIKTETKKIEERERIILTALYIMSDNNDEIQNMIESYEEEE